MKTGPPPSAARSAGWLPVDPARVSAPAEERPHLSLRSRLRNRLPDRWGIGAGILSGIIALPVLAVLYSLGGASPEWAHLVETVLPGYLKNTFGLVIGVVAIALFFAVPPAWLVTMCEFPGRRFFSWALVLPLAIPTYVAAFVFSRGPEAAIPLLVWIRREWGVDAFLFAESALRHGLLTLMMAGVLFPYLYLAARAAFSQQGRAAIDAARSLGSGPTRVFFRVALPMARPALVAGAALVVMEVINDYGAVHFFGVPTLTEGIFRTWFGMGDKVAALRLAGLAMLAVAVLLILERMARGGARYTEAEASSPPLSRRRLHGRRAVFAWLTCLLPLALGFLYPAGHLTVWAGLHLASENAADFPGLDAVSRGVGVAVTTAACATLVAGLFAYAIQLRNNRARRIFARVAGLGYAMPGAVVAVGVLAVMGGLDRQALPGLPLLSGTLFAIGFAYFVRFFAIPLQLASAGLDRIGRPLEEASRLLGKGPFSTFLRIDLPLLRGPLVAAGMLLFVDLLKELPLTLILRPADFETLATSAFGFAKEARLQACAVPSLLIVIVGAAGLLLANRWFSGLPDTPPSARRHERV